MTSSDHFLFKRYALHYFLQSFFQSLFFSFGVLLIYAKTDSISLAIVYGLISSFLSLFLKSIALRYWWKRMAGYSIVYVMLLGMVCTAGSFMGLYFLHPGSVSFVDFSVIILLSALGNSFYWIPSNALYLYVVGASKHPGRYSALLSIAFIAASVLSAVAGLLFNIRDHFILLLPVAAVMVVVSVAPLLNVHIPLRKDFGFRASWKSLSWGAIAANMNPDHRFMICALPLFLAEFFHSVSASIWIMGVTAILSALCAYFAGQHKDGKKSAIYIAALVVNVGVWIGYGVATTVGVFVLLGVLLQVASTTIDTGREARLSREMANAGDATATSIAIEFARSLASVFGLVIILVLYYIYGHIPQASFAIAALFVLPRALYAIGDVKEHRVIANKVVA